VSDRDRVPRVLQNPKLSMELTFPASLVVDIRPDDGYVNATKLCQTTGKSWKHYYQPVKTKTFLKALSECTRLSLNVLVVNGKNRFQHTWIHPDVAIHLAQWLSPHVAVAVVEMVRRFAAEHPDKVIHQITDALEKTVDASCCQVKGFVYILQTELVPSRVKIGFSTQTLPALRDRYRTSFPDKTTILAFPVSNAAEAEADVHSFFDDCRQAGEWFDGEKIEEYVEYLTNVHDGEIFQLSDDDCH